MGDGLGDVELKNENGSSATDLTYVFHTLMKLAPRTRAEFSSK